MVLLAQCESLLNVFKHRTENPWILLQSYSSGFAMPTTRLSEYSPSPTSFQSKHGARNYLQSPYYFMCCNLWDATEDRPALPASPTDTSSVLAGTVVSSLHRLKDSDNSGIRVTKHH